MDEEHGYRGWSRMEERQLAELVARGTRRDEIAARLRRSRSAIGARIARLGIAADSRRAFSDADDRAIRRARADGTTYAAIARRLGRSEGAVKGRARWLGIVIRRHAHTGGRKPAPRKCLVHGGAFQPGHRHEFVCTTCKESEEWQAGPWMG